jgi:nucleoside-diphosphate-sugar epimerase
VIVRPTLVYGGGMDRNVSDIARFIRRWHVFPLVGQGSGLRQPLHSADLAALVLRAARDEAVANVALNVCGGETLSYRSMVLRIAAAMECRVVLISIPRWLLRGCIVAARRLPRFRALSPALADRMIEDLVVNGLPAAKLLGFSARPFVLGDGDIPS